MLSFLLLFLAVTIALFPTPSLSACPSSCSGHGTCGAENLCSCDASWGTAPDCSLRECPAAVSWGTKPYAASLAHKVIECAGVGICVPATGRCACPVGFTGQACERLACPNDCNGQGTCQVRVGEGGIACQLRSLPSLFVSFLPFSFSYFPPFLLPPFVLLLPSFFLLPSSSIYVPFLRQTTAFLFTSRLSSTPASLTAATTL